MTDKFTFKTSDEIGKLIRDLADSDHEGNLSKAIISLLEKTLNMENRYEILGDGCPARTYIDDHWECTWGRIGKTPETKKIGISDEALNNRCKACKKTINLKEENLMMKEQLNKGIVISIPSCDKGGRLNDTMDELYCPLYAKWTKIETCKKMGAKNSNCKFLRHTQTVIKGKLPKIDGQNL